MKDELCEKLEREVRDALQRQWIEMFHDLVEDSGCRLEVDADRMENQNYLMKVTLYWPNGEVANMMAAWIGDWKEYSNKPGEMASDAAQDMKFNFYRQAFFGKQSRKIADQIID